MPACFPPSQKPSTSMPGCSRPPCLAAPHKNPSLLCTWLQSISISTELRRGFLFVPDTSTIYQGEDFVSPSTTSFFEISGSVSVSHSTINLSWCNCFCCYFDFGFVDCRISMFLQRCSALFGTNTPDEQFLHSLIHPSSSPSYANLYFGMFMSCWISFSCS